MNRKLIFYIIVDVINVSVTIAVFVMITWKLFFFLTLLSFVSCTIYFLVETYIEFALSTKREVSENIQAFWRNKYYKYALITSKVVFVCFWGLLACGPTFMALPGITPILWILNIYLHGGMTALMIADLFITDHLIEYDFTQDLIIMGVINVGYIIIQWIGVWTLDYYVYPFLKYLSWNQLIIAYVVITLVMFNLYLLYFQLHKHKTKREEKQRTISVGDLKNVSIVKYSTLEENKSPKR